MPFAAGQRVRASQLTAIEDAVTVGGLVTDLEVAYQNTTSASYVALTGGPEVVFTAPASGIALVTIGAAMVAGDATTRPQMSFEIRAGNTPGSGTLFLATSDSNSVKMTGAQDFQLGMTVPVAGLTPGAVYNARALYRRSAGAAVAGFAERRIVVLPFVGLG